MQRDQTVSGKTYRLVIMAALSAILLIGQLGMAFLPNIEVVSTLIILYTFVLLEGVVFGFGIWWVSYLYIWSILALIVLALRKMDSALLWAVVSGAFGLSFGVLCAIPYLISGGLYAAFSYWSAGIPYDILHCAGNFVLTLALYRPLSHLLKRLRREQQ